MNGHVLQGVPEWLMLSQNERSLSVPFTLMSHLPQVTILLDSIPYYRVSQND